MKRIVFILALLGIPALSFAGSQVPQLTYQVGISSITSTLITVSTSSMNGATQADNPTLTSRVSLEIQNIDGTANLWCLPTSTMPVVNGGRKIAAGSSWIVSFTDKLFTPTTSSSRGATVNFWCLSDGTSPTKAVVTQLY